MSGFTGVRAIDLPAEPRARGAAHGEECRDVIHEAIDRWYASLPSDSPREWIAGFAAATSYREAIERWTPTLLDEVAGLAAGAGVDEATMYAFQLVDEQWAYARDPHGEHCSVVGCAAAGAAVRVAQNLDLPGWWDGTQVALRIPAWNREPGCFVVTGCGFIAMNGVNDEGVGIVVNALPDVPSARHGLPVAYVIRGALTRRTAADAASFVEGVDHASGQHYLIGDPGGLVALECDAAGVAAVDAEDGVVVHTNHAVARPSSMVNGDGAGGALANSVDRLGFLTAERAALAVDAGDAAMRAVLSNETVPIRRVPTDVSPSQTFASMIFELTQSPTAWVRGGLDDADFEAFAVTKPESSRTSRR